MGIRHELRKRIWAFGFDISRFNPQSNPTVRLRLLLTAHMVGVVLDVGASSGEWGQTLREEVGFAGLICSFEPTKAAFNALQVRAARYADWKSLNCALGDVDGRQTINIAGNSHSSSILKMLPAHEAAAPDSRFVGEEEIEVRTLDGLFDELVPPGERVYLKVDAQGYEGHVLAGARHSLAKVDVVQLEMSLVALYEGQPTLIELLELMRDEGYVLVALDPGFTDPRTGYVLQVDGTFRRAGEPDRTQRGGLSGLQERSNPSR
jgi:FkbM family methyltransferase